MPATGISEIEVICGLALRSPSEVAIITRTMLGIITELAMDVEPSEVHLLKSWAFVNSRLPREMKSAPLVRLRRFRG